MLRFSHQAAPARSVAMQTEPCPACDKATQTEDPPRLERSPRSRTPLPTQMPAYLQLQLRLDEIEDDADFDPADFALCTLPTIAEADESDDSDASDASDASEGTQELDLLDCLTEPAGWRQSRGGRTAE